LNNNNLIATMTVRLADSYITTGEYEAARRLLEETAATDAGRDDLDVALALGAVFVRLGDLQSARGRLERVAATIETSGQLALMPRAQTVLGELEYEAGKPAEARMHFSKALSNWIDDLPDAASVMAGCDLGLLDALTGNAAAGQATVEKSVKHARRMGRLALEAECRLRLARIHLIERRYADALAVLSEMPSQGDQALGPDLRAEIHYWRGHAMAERGDRAGAESETAAAQTIMKELRASLPEPYRESFASRIDVRPVLQDDPIRDLR
jgi:tetratricopeptide (TPR) repeat protein